MSLPEKAQHNLLLIITALLFLIFSAGLAAPIGIEPATVIVSG